MSKKVQDQQAVSLVDIEAVMEEEDRVHAEQGECFFFAISFIYVFVFGA